MQTNQRSGQKLQAKGTNQESNREDLPQNAKGAWLKSALEGKETQVKVINS